MRKFLMLSSAVFLMTVPAMAADVKQEIEKSVNAYMEGVAKQDGAAIAKLYVAKDPIWIGPNGEIKTDIKATYEENFKNGENKIVSKIDQIWVQSDDAALAKGSVDVTYGKDPPIPAYWSSVNVREGGQMKIKMLTVGIKPPPPPAQAQK